MFLSLAFRVSIWHFNKSPTIYVLIWSLGLKCFQCWGPALPAVHLGFGDQDLDPFLRNDWSILSTATLYWRCVMGHFSHLPYTSPLISAMFHRSVWTKAVGLPCGPLWVSILRDPCHKAYQRFLALVYISIRSAAVPQTITAWG